MAKFGKDLIYRTKVIVQKPVWTPARHRHTQSHNTVLLVIVLFVFLRFTDSDHPFDIFKFFLSVMYSEIKGERQKTKDRVTLTPPKTEGELRCSGRISSSCSTCDICRVTRINYSKGHNGSGLKKEQKRSFDKI
jgi:hypothetical protein